MQNYELLFILPGTLSEDEVKPAVEAVKNTVTQNGGQNYTCEDMGKSRLAYPIKHIRYGYFQLAHFEAEAVQVVAIEKKLRLLTQLLRALVQKFDSKTSMSKIVFESLGPAEPMVTTPEMAVALNLNNREAKADVASEPEATLETKTVKVDEGAPLADVQDKKEEKKPVTRGRKKTEKVSLDDIDKKLDEILEIDINKV